MTEARWLFRPDFFINFALALRDFKSADVAGWGHKNGLPDADCRTPTRPTARVR